MSIMIAGPMGQVPVSTDSVQVIFALDLEAEAEKYPVGSYKRLEYDVRNLARKSLQIYPDLRKCLGETPTEQSGHRLPKRWNRLEYGTLTELPTLEGLPRFLWTENERKALVAHNRAVAQEHAEEEYAIVVSKSSNNRRLLCNGSESPPLRKYAKNELMGLPCELKQAIVENVGNVDDLNNLSQTCTEFRGMIEGMNIADFVSGSEDTDLCAPFPHAVLGARAHSLADWVVDGKDEVINVKHSLVRKPESKLNEEKRRALFDRVMQEEGTCGLAYLAVNLVGLKMSDLRMFQTEMKKWANIRGFGPSGMVHTWLTCNPNMTALTYGIGELVAVANRLIYCGLFHHEVDNLTIRDRDRFSSLGWQTRCDWLYFCVPDARRDQSDILLWQYQGIDRMMLRALLENSDYVAWTGRIKIVWSNIFDRDERRGSPIPFEVYLKERMLNRFDFRQRCIERYALMTASTLRYTMPQTPRGLFPHSEMTRRLSDEYGYTQMVTRDLMLGRTTGLISEDPHTFRGVLHDIYSLVRAGA